MSVQSESSIPLLLVEDEPMDAEIVEMVLAGTPFTITHVTTLAEAEEQLREGGVEIIVLDLNLPDSKGTETVARVSAASSAQPIVVLTANEDEQDGIEALRAGAHDYLAKSDSLRVLLPRTLRYARERARLEAELARQREATERIKLAALSRRPPDRLLLEEFFTFYRQHLVFYFEASGASGHDIVSQVGTRAFETRIDARALVDVHLRAMDDHRRNGGAPGDVESGRFFLVGILVALCELATLRNEQPQGAYQERSSAGH